MLFRRLFPKKVDYYKIPLVDLSLMPQNTPDELKYLYNYSVVDDGEGYLGHPDSVLLNNGDILTFYPKGHGKGAILSKISDNGGVSYEMEIEMPGFERDQINMKLENGYITVSAKKESKTDDKYLKRERATSYSRSYYVGDVNKADVKAKYVNGILTVSVPKEQQKICHSINID